MTKNITIRAAILKRENDLLEAIKSSDIVHLDKLLHDDLLFISPGGQAVTKQMDLDAHRSGAMIVEALKPTVEQVNIIENTAVVVIVYETKGSMMGVPVEGSFRYIRIWKLFYNGWQVVAGSCVQI